LASGMVVPGRRYRNGYREINGPPGVVGAPRRSLLGGRMLTGLGASCGDPAGRFMTGHRLLLGPAGSRGGHAATSGEVRSSTSTFSGRSPAVVALRRFIAAASLANMAAAAALASAWACRSADRNITSS